MPDKMTFTERKFSQEKWYDVEFNIDPNDVKPNITVTFLIY